MALTLEAALAMVDEEIEALQRSYADLFGEAKRTAAELETMRLSRQALRALPIDRWDPPEFAVDETDELARLRSMARRGTFDVMLAANEDHERIAQAQLKAKARAYVLEGEL